jgi:hypothetical protein
MMTGWWVVNKGKEEEEEQMKERERERLKYLLNADGPGICVNSCTSHNYNIGNLVLMLTLTSKLVSPVSTHDQYDAKMAAASI